MTPQVLVCFLPLLQRSLSSDCDFLCKCINILLLLRHRLTQNICVSADHAWKGYSILRFQPVLIHFYCRQLQVHCYSDTKAFRALHIKFWIFFIIIILYIFVATATVQGFSVINLNLECFYTNALPPSIHCSVAILAKKVLIMFEVGTWKFLRCSIVARGLRDNSFCLLPLFFLIFFCINQNICLVLTHLWSVAWVIYEVLNINLPLWDFDNDPCIYNAWIFLYFELF